MPMVTSAERLGQGRGRRGNGGDSKATEILKQENIIMVCITPEIHMKRIRGFTTGNAEKRAIDQDGAPTPTPRDREHMAPCDDGVVDFESPFCNNSMGDVFGGMDESSGHTMEQHRHPSGGVATARRCSTSLLSEDLERVSSKKKKQLHETSNFETQMAKLKCLSIRKEGDLDGEPDTCHAMISRTVSCRGMPGELRVQIHKNRTRTFNEHEQHKKSPGSAGSSGSEAMPIPSMSRACTAPDQLPELSSSMLESLLEEREREERKNKSPKEESLLTPNRYARRTNTTGRRVPSAAFLEDLAALQERQYSVFKNVSEKRTMTRHHLYSE